MERKSKKFEERIDGRIKVEENEYEEEKAKLKISFQILY